MSYISGITVISIFITSSLSFSTVICVRAINACIFQEAECTRTCTCTCPGHIQLKRGAETVRSNKIVGLNSNRE